MKVISIVSAGRSGSTLLDMLLGSVDGFFSAGELRYLWERGVIERRHCGCGREVSECPVWSRVLDSPASSALDPAEMVERQHDLAGTRHTHRLLRAIGAPDHDPELAKLTATMNALYEETAAVTGARVIVDSSKRPADAALTTLLPGVDPYIIHLVRDPCAVAYSGRRHKAEYDRADRLELERHPVARTAANWVWCNAVASAIPRHAPDVPFLRVRYEDVVADPVATLARILAWVDEPATTLSVHGDVAELRTNHTVSGNPARFTTGAVEIRLDSQWRRAMKTRSWCAATAISLPSIRRYGYAIGTGAPWDDGAIDAVVDQPDRSAGLPVPQ